MRLSEPFWRFGFRDQFTVLAMKRFEMRFKTSKNLQQAMQSFFKNGFKILEQTLQYLMIVAALGRSWN